MTDDDLRALSRLDRPAEADPAFAEELFTNLRTGMNSGPRPTPPLLFAATLVVLLAVVGGTLAVGSRISAPGSPSASPSVDGADVSRLPWWQMEIFEEDDRFAGGVLRIGYTDGTTTAEHEVAPEDDSFAVSPPVAGYVAIADRSDDGSDRVRLVRISDGSERTLLEIPDVVVALSIAPDGSGLYVGTADRDDISDAGTWWVPFASGELVPVIPPQAERPMGMSEIYERFTWTPDGSRLFAQTCAFEAEVEVCRWSVIEHSTRQVTEFAPDGVGRMAGLTNDHLLARALHCVAGPCPFVLVELATATTTPMDLDAHSATLAQSSNETLILTGPCCGAVGPGVWVRNTGPDQTARELESGGVLVPFPERQGLAPPPGWIVVGFEESLARETTEGPPRLVRLSDGAVVEVAHLERLVATATATPTSPETSATPPSAPTPAPSRVPGAVVAPGDMAGVIADEPLVLRTAPGTGVDSAILDTGLLHQGQRARVLEGPVAASGYDWYLLRVGELEGWVAAASREGEPWLTRVRNGAIAHVRGQSAESIEIYTVMPDGSEESLLTTVGPETGVADPPIQLALSCAYGVYEPSWSVAGDSVVFSLGGCDMEVYRADIGSAAPTRLVAGHWPAWSPNGASVAFAANVPYCPDVAGCGDGDGPWDISVVDVQGGEPREASSLDAGFAAAMPDWSPDGTRIAFSAQQLRDPMSAPGIYVVDAVGGGQTRLTDGIRPAWSPDGTRIAFERSVEDGASSEIWVIGADGDGLQRLTEGSEPEWSPDGSVIAFRRMAADENGPTTPELRLVDPDGSNDRLLTVAWAFDWSPDGSMLALSRVGSEGPEIYTINVDGSAETRIAQGEWPAWQPQWEEPIPVP